jgi:hypothetical protein
MIPTQFRAYTDAAGVFVWFIFTARGPAPSRATKAGRRPMFRAPLSGSHLTVSGRSPHFEPHRVLRRQRHQKAPTHRRAFLCGLSRPGRARFGYRIVGGRPPCRANAQNVSTAMPCRSSTRSGSTASRQPAERQDSCGKVSDPPSELRTDQDQEARSDKNHPDNEPQLSVGRHVRADEGRGVGVHRWQSDASWRFASGGQRRRVTRRARCWASVASRCCCTRP